jgi:CheY-specific phosphatase CheX
MKLQSILFENEEENAVEPGMEAMANKLAQAVEKELEANKEEIQSKEGQVNESAIIGVIGYVLLSNTVANMLAKMFKWLAKKYNKPGMMDNAEWWYNFTHKNEDAFMAPIKRIIGLFTKNEARKKGITKIIYSIIIFGMAGSAGGSALQFLKQTKWATAAAYSAKALIKGVEVNTLINGAVEDLLS